MCSEHTWSFHYRGVPNEGVSVVLKRNGLGALFTPGAPRDWRTTEGLLLGERSSSVVELHGRCLPRTACAGRPALSMRTRTAVTSISMTDDPVCGFALMLPWTPVCR